MQSAVVPVSLVSLFSTLLSGCFASSSCDDFKGGTYSRMVELSPEQYAMYQMGIVPADTTGSPTTTAATTSGGSMTETDSATAGSTTDAATTGTTTTTTGTTTGVTTETTTTGMMLSEADTCAAVCMHEAQEFGELQSCSVEEMDSKVVVTCVYPAYCEGRRHACVASRGANDHAEQTGAWLARAAHDEAASVQAFHALARELAAWGAPPELLARLEAAADDEVRHAAITALLARRHGAEPVEPRCVAVPVRALVAIAVENAVEGCVRETWAALAAAHQARFAATAELRAMYAEIAADEARHAELAWAIDAWLMGQLDAGARVEVAAARRAAADELLAVAAQVDAPAELGVPAGAVASRLCAGLDAALWSRAA